MRRHVNHLQPYRVFQAEATAINDLYWKTRYTYRRTSEALGAREKVAGRQRVHALWPAAEPGEERHVTVTLDDLRESLDDNLAALRRTSVLYVCSALENALCAYFVLGCLYRPAAIDAGWSGPAGPALAGDRARYDEVRKKALEAVGPDRSKQKLRGKYRKRIETLDALFGAGVRTAALPASLDAHYATRHLIAHGQGLTGGDDPVAPAEVTLASRVEVSEAAWKTMLADFGAAVSEIDRAMRDRVVSDDGVALAVAYLLDGDGGAGGAITIGELRSKIAMTWRMTVTAAEIADALRALGRATSGERKLERRTLR